MATPGKPLEESTRNWIARAVPALGIRGTAKEAQVSRNTVRKIVRQALQSDPPTRQV